MEHLVRVPLKTELLLHLLPMVICNLTLAAPMIIFMALPIIPVQPEQSLPRGLNQTQTGFIVCGIFQVIIPVLPTH